MPSIADLSRREQEVLELLAGGLSNAAIARQLWITQKTLESHVCRIFAKLELPQDGERNRRVLATLRWWDAA